MILKIILAIIRINKYNKGRSDAYDFKRNE